MIQIDPTSYTPPFEQLRVQLAERIRSGHLRPGQRLPTVRKLAGDLGLAPNTVARTYRQLEADGLVDTRGRNGTSVRAQGDASERAARAAADAYVQQMHELHIASTDALRFIAEALGS